MAALNPCKSPSGLAISTKARRLFAACDNKLLAAVDADTGRLVSTLPIGDGPDAAAFDPGTGIVFSSNGDGTLTIIVIDIDVNVARVVAHWELWNTVKLNISHYLPGGRIDHGHGLAGLWPTKIRPVVSS